MSTPDPFGAALDAKAAQGDASAGSADPYGDALAARAQGRHFGAKPDKPADASREITEGPIGFVNGIAESAGNVIGNIPYGAAHAGVDLWRRWTGGDTSAPDPAAVSNLRIPLSQNAENVQGGFGSVASKTPSIADQIGTLRQNRLGTPNATLADVVHQTAGVAGDVAGLAPVVAPVAGRLLNRGGAAAADVGSAEDVVARNASSQSMGAAGAATNLTETSPTLKQAIVDAARRNGGAVNSDAMKAHIEAENNGVQLMKGQATRDPVQYSAEQNSTDPRIAARKNLQNQQLTDRLDEIRRDTAPTSVHNDAIQNGQTVVDRLKAYDEPVKADIAAKYKALTDANGGTIPLDTGSFLTNVDAALKKKYLTSSVPPGAQDLLSSLRAGEPLDFEGFEAARSRLAEAQRAGGSQAQAAGTIRNELEQMPLSSDAAKLKGLADTARSAAKARFDALDRDPAYRAAVDEADSGIKRGEPSPLADRFLDKYALGTAPKANVDVMLSKLDEESQGAVASHTLNQMRNAAIGKNGTVLPSGFSSAMQKYAPKMDSLLPPSTIEDLQSLGKTINDVKVAPEGAHVNYTKSGVIVNAANAAQGAAEHVINAKTGGLYSIGKSILGTDKIANEKFVNDALKPGAGIDSLRSR